MVEEISKQTPVGTGEKKKGGKWLYVIIAVLVIAVIGLGAMALKDKPENDQEAKTADITATEQEKPFAPQVMDKDQYNWSTMDQGPYHDKVSFATSSDLLNWKDSNTILAEHASVPDAVYKDGVIYVYFVDVTTDGIPEQIGLIKSSDNGKTWGQRQIVKIEGLGDRVAVDPAPFLLDDGRIRLYYFDISKTRKEGLQNNAIYSAVSSDGVIFKQESDTRFKYPAIFDPCVIKVGDTWRMYVGTEDQKVLSTTSTDGLNFTYEGVALIEGAIPNVVYENETYYLFTGGIDISSSKDGKTFTKLQSRFVVKDKMTADPGVVKLGPNSYLMVYKTKDMNSAGQPPAPTGNQPPPLPGN